MTDTEDASTALQKVTEDTLVRDVINNPVFETFGRLLFPVHRNISDTLTLKNVDSILTWYNYVRPEKTVEIVNTLMERAAGGGFVYVGAMQDSFPVALELRNCK